MKQGNDTTVTANMELAGDALRSFGALTVQGMAARLGVAPNAAGVILRATEAKGLTQRAEVPRFHVLTREGQKLAGCSYVGRAMTVNPRYVRHADAMSAVVRAWEPRYGELIGEAGLRHEERVLTHELMAKSGLSYAECAEQAIIARAVMGEKKGGGLSLRCPDFAVRGADGKWTVGELETAYKSEQWCLRYSKAWLRCEQIRGAVYVVPRDRSDILNQMVRVIDKAEKETGVAGKIRVVTLEDLLEGKSFPRSFRVRA